MFYVAHVQVQPGPECSLMTGDLNALCFQGCYDELVAWLEDNAVILIAIAFAIAVIEVR